MYVSQDINVASVTANGLVTGNTQGATAITVSNNLFSQDIPVMIPIKNAMLAPWTLTKVQKDPETGEEILVNRLLVEFAQEMSMSDGKIYYQQLCAIVGFFPLSNQYVFEFDTDSIAELEVIASQIESENGVISVLEDIVVYGATIPIDVKGLNEKEARPIVL